MIAIVTTGTTSRVARLERKDREEGEWEEGANEKRRSPPVTPAQMDDSVAGEKIAQYGSMTDAEVLEGVPDTDINMA